MGRHAYRHIGRQIGRQTDTQAGRQTDRQAGRHTSEKRERCGGVGEWYCGTTRLPAASYLQGNTV